MSLAIGRRLGAFEITGSPGAGVMMPADATSRSSITGVVTWFTGLVK